MTQRLLEAISSHRIYDLAEPLDAGTLHSPSHPAVTTALLRRHGDAVRKDGGSSAFEVLHMGTHTGTHIDAFCHASVDGVMFGGVPASEAAAGGSFAELGVETIEPIFCRGVLLDVPRALNQDAMRPGQPITADGLARAEALAGVTIQRGDVVLVRTGRPCGGFPDADDPRSLEVGVPGVDISAAGWLAGREIRGSGSDTIAYEWVAPGAGMTDLPVHTLFLCRAGILIIELLRLEELARDETYVFLFVAVPLKLSGATGSPLRPLAIVSP